MFQTEFHVFPYPRILIFNVVSYGLSPILPTFQGFRFIKISHCLAASRSPTNYESRYVLPLVLRVQSQVASNTYVIMQRPLAVGFPIRKITGIKACSSSP